jgi:hypothetical protein
MNVFPRQEEAALLNYLPEAGRLPAALAFLFQIDKLHHLPGKPVC